MLQKRRELRWAIFFIGLIAGNFPVISVFNKPDLVFNLPLLLVYLFLLWALFIYLTYRLSKKQS